MKNPSSDDQKDLFPVQEGSQRANPESIRTFFRLKSNPLYPVSLEQIFVTLIVLLILFVLVFMMGVLRGRALKQGIEGRAPATALVRPPAAARSAANGMPAASATGSLKEQNSVRIAPAAPIQPPLANTAKKPYTIQLVTYRNEDRALKEIADLRARGLQPHLIRRSGYYEICVGQYADRKEAEKDLRTLGSRYKGCYLRKI
jgi:cell division septation protein DedD